MTRAPLAYTLAVLVLSAAVGGIVWYFPSAPVHPDSPAPGDEAVVPAFVSPTEPARPPSPQLPPGVEIRFVDATAAAGVNFRHFDGATPLHYIMETMGSGAGWLDYDQDGLMDLFLVQGGSFAASHPPTLPTCKLFRNLGGGRFQDVTAEAGLAHVGCGQGVAIGDIDNDGYPDLFLTCFGKPNVLYHNVPDGKGGRCFRDITATAGLAAHPDWKERPNYSTSAAFLDYNGDGFLDLFVCSYVRVDLDHYPVCRTSAGSHRLSCPPSLFAATRCLLYRNNGNGTFTEVSHEAGVDLPQAKALGVVALDLDGDGHTDLFVANDGVPNFLFRNTGRGRFEALGPECGCSVNLQGQPQAYMGVDADDLHGEGRPDLFATAFAFETNTLFRNEGRCQFLDATHRSGLGPPSWFMLGFGTAFFDADGDGSLDIVVANGHVSRHIDDEGNPSVTFRQPAQLFLNNGRGRFQDVSGVVGDYFRQPHVGRGVALCDYDNDGHMDIAISNNGEAAYLLHNESKTPCHWVRLELRGTRSNRDAVGAQVTVHAGGRQLVRHRKGGGSYLSASDPRLLVGIGRAERVDAVDIRWPSGRIQKVGSLAADRGYRITEGVDEVEGRP
jgi:hypothetical protein